MFISATPDFSAELTVGASKVSLSAVKPKNKNVNKDVLETEEKTMREELRDGTSLRMD